MTKKIVTLSGDGIGPESWQQVLEFWISSFKIEFDYDVDAKPLVVLVLMLRVIHFLKLL